MIELSVNPADARRADVINVRWRKSTYTNAIGNCVELAHTQNLVRDSKHRGPVLAADVSALLVAIKDDQITGLVP
jgi:hypothetical protein